MKKTLLALFIVLLLGSGAYAFFYYNRYAKESVPVAIDVKDVIQKNGTGSTIKPTPSLTPIPVTSESVSDLPANLNLKAAFFSQAPYGNWDYPWQEACEEASILIIANEYLDKNWDTAQFNQEILKLVDWQNEKFGDYQHTTMAQTAEMLEANYGLKSILHDNPTLEDLKRILAKGHFIVLPLAGRELGNPYFTNGGPPYHAVTLKGYKDNGKLIVHDVGTKRGEDYVYPWPVIDYALHDYADPIYKGMRRIIEVLPP